MHSKNGMLYAVFCLCALLNHGCSTSPTESNLILVPAGTFMMGSDYGKGSKPNYFRNEQPIHQVTLRCDFYLGTHEVTNQEYMSAVQWAYDQELVRATSNTVQAYGQELLDLDDDDCEITFNDGVFGMRESHSNSTQRAYPSGYDPTNHPVTNVSWFGAACYCDWLSELAGLPPFYQGNWDQTVEHNPYNADGYRLPTEAEWEYAAQYNDNRTYPWGIMKHLIMLKRIGRVDWTEPVGSCPAGNSRLGLQDMAGNVAERTGDWYDPEYYSYSPSIDPLGATNGAYIASNGLGSGSYRVSRGGFNGLGKVTFRSAYRGVDYPYSMHSAGGFRICRTAQ